MVAEDGNFYFRKTSLGTGFSACNCLFDSRNCLLHLWYWASTINWIGQNGPLQFIDSWGHYFTPGRSMLPTPTSSNLVETMSIPLSLGDAADCCLGAGVRHQEQAKEALQPSNSWPMWSELCLASAAHWILVFVNLNAMKWKLCLFPPGGVP